MQVPRVKATPHKKHIVSGSKHGESPVSTSLSTTRKSQTVNTPDLFKLDALVAGNTKNVMSDMKASRRDIYMVPLDKLSFIDNFNVRDDTPEYLAHIEQIAQSIHANGFMADKPLSIFVDEHGNCKVVDGHTRYRATKRAAELGTVIDALPSVVMPRGTSIEDLNYSLVNKNGGKGLTPYETAKVIKRQLDLGIDEKTVAFKFAIGVAYLHDLMTLVAAPKAIRDMVVQGELSPTAAIKEINNHGSKAVTRLTKGLAAAKAAGKTKVTGKHLDKPKLRVSGTVAKIGANNKIVIELSDFTGIIMAGDSVKIIVTPQKDEEL